MKIHQSRSPLYRSLTTESADRSLIEATTRHEILSPYPTVSSLLLELSDATLALYARRERLTRVFIEEAQRTSGVVWFAALLIAYQPMLVKLRKRLIGDLDDDDLDQLVVEAFLDTVRAFPLDRLRDRTALRLRQQTARAVFRQLLQERNRRRELVEIAKRLADDPEFAPFGGLPIAIGDGDRPELEQALTRYAREVAPDYVELLVRTTVGGESLADFVAREFADLDADQRRRKYEALKRQRQRLLEKVRQRLRTAVSDAEDTDHEERCAL